MVMVPWLKLMISLLAEGAGLFKKFAMSGTIVEFAKSSITKRENCRVSLFSSSILLSLDMSRHI